MPVRISAGLVLLAVIPSCYRAAPIDEAAMLREVRAEARAGAGQDGEPEPLTEEAAVAAAMASSPRVVEARGDLAVARGKVHEARQVDNPELRATTENAIGSADDRDQFELAVRFRPPNPWVLSANVGEAKAEVRLAEARLAVEEARARRDARVAYLRAAHAAARAALADELFGIEERRVSIARAAAERGAFDPLDLARAEADLAEARGAAARARGRQFEALSALAAMTGRAKLAVEPLDRATCPTPPADVVAAEDLAVARGARVAEVRAAHARAEASVREENARQIPWIRWLQVGWERRFSEPPDPVDGSGGSPTRDGIALGVSIDLPILDWNLGAVKRAMAGRDREKARLRAALASVIATVRAAHARWRGARDSLDALAGQAIPAAERAVETANRAAAAGRIGEIDLLAARARVLKLRASLLDAALECREAAAEFEHATGVVP